MKPTLLFLLLLLIGINTKTQATNKLFQDESTFFIKKIDKSHYTILYHEAKTPVYVTVSKDSITTVFNVKCSNLSVDYKRNNNGFGLRLKGNKHKQIETPFVVEQFHQQSLLCPRYITKQKCIELIAEYFPELLTTQARKEILAAYSAE